jgi:uncharacterized protein (TIGR02996 family)
MDRFDPFFRDHPATHSLLAAAAEAPDDDTPRLVLSDWLEEHDQLDRARFIRLQCEAARPGVPWWRRQALELEAAALWRTHASEWRAGLPEEVFAPLGRQPDVFWWERGLFERFRPESLAELYAIQEPLGTRTSVRHLDLRWSQLTPGDFVELLRGMWRAPWNTLDLSRNGLAGSALRMLAPLPWLGSLAVLKLAGTSFGADGVHAMSYSSYWKRLSTLDLSENGLDAVAVGTLAASEAWPRLSRLFLGHNHFGDDGAKELAASSLPERLTVLDLSGNDLGLGGIEALVSARWKRLAYLDLLGNPFGDTGLQRLSSEGEFDRLTTLSVARTRCGPAGLCALLAASWAPRVQQLVLQGNELGDEGAEVLAAASALPLLGELNLASNHLHDVAVAALAESPVVGRLTLLDLHWNAISAAGARVLAHSPHLAHLTALDLYGNHLGDAGVAKLLDADWPRLSYLDVRENNVSEAMGQHVQRRWPFALVGSSEATACIAGHGGYH